MSILKMLDAAMAAGARLERACSILGVSVRTAQRWRAMDGGENRRHGGDFATLNLVDLSPDDHPAPHVDDHVEIEKCAAHGGSPNCCRPSGRPS